MIKYTDAIYKLRNLDKKMRAKWLVALYLFFLIVIYVNFYSLPGRLEIELQTDQDIKGQVFFMTDAKSFTEELSEQYHSEANSQWQQVSMRYPHNLKELRIDPAKAKAEILIRKISLSTWYDDIELDLRDIYDSGVKNDEVIMQWDELKQVLQVTSLGNNPTFIINVEQLVVLSCVERMGIASLLSLVVVGLLYIFCNRLLYLREQNFYQKYWIYGILSFAFYWKYAVLLQNPLPIGAVFLDESTYYFCVTYIQENGFLAYLTNEYSVMAAMGNIIYLELLHILFGGDVFWIRQVNVIISCLTIFFMYKTAELMFNRATGLLAAVFLSINIYMIGYSFTLLTEPLFLFLLSIVMYLLSRLFNGRGNRAVYLVGIGVFLAMSALTRTIALLLPILLFLVFLWFWYRERTSRIKLRYMKDIAIIVLLFFTIISPFMIKNYYLFHTPSLATGGGAALWLASREDTKGDEPPYRGKEYDTMKVIGKKTLHISLEGDRRLKEAGIQNIKNDPLNYLISSICRVGRVTIGHNYAWFFGSGDDIMDYYRSYGTKDTMKHIFNIFLQTGVYVLGLFGMVRTWKCTSKRFLHGSIIYFLLFSIPFLVNLRYGLPIYMLISVFAAAELLYLKNERKKMKAMALLSGAVLIVVYICSGL